LLLYDRISVDDQFAGPDLVQVVGQLADAVRAVTPASESTRAAATRPAFVLSVPGAPKELRNPRFEHYRIDHHP
jgi:hypothetical protein